jgi:hypothetical protein
MNGPLDQSFTTSDGVTLSPYSETITGGNIGNYIIPFSGGYQVNGYTYWPPTVSSPTEKAFAAAKHLLDKKLIVAKTPQEFIAIVEELRSVL